MSFGRPPTFTDFKVNPPQRGSFPLDHDGECKEFMKTYLQCLKTHGQESGNCRPLSKEYLECRMSRALMDRTDWKSLGYKDVGEDQNAPHVKDSVGVVKATTPSEGQ